MMIFNNEENPHNIPRPTEESEIRLKYKLKDIRVYASDEWMADGNKKYRRVFDRWEVSYHRVEFSFFNKLFDELDWEDYTFNLTSTSK